VSRRVGGLFRAGVPRDRGRSDSRAARTVARQRISSIA
jgi:hypothetical protein